MNIKNVIRIEEFVFVLFAIYLFSMLDYVWWWFVVLFLVAGPHMGFLSCGTTHRGYRLQFGAS